MATKEKFKEKRLFKVARELNVSTDRVENFLEEEGYADALSGSGFNASITDEEAYLVLRKEYADDAQAAARVRELRQGDDEEEESYSRDEVTSLEEKDVSADEEEPDAATEETVAEEPATEAAVEDAEASEVAAADAEASVEAEPTDAEEDVEAPADDEEAKATDTEAAAAQDEEVEADPADDVAQGAVEGDDEPAADVDAQGEAEAPSAADEALPEAEESAEADAPAADEKEEAAVAEEPSTDEAPEEPAEASPEEVTADAETPDDTKEMDEADAADEPEKATETEATEAETTAGEDADAAASDEEADDTLKANRYRLKGTNVVGKVDLAQMRKRQRRRKRKRKEKKKKKERERKQKQHKKKHQKKKKQKKKKRKPSEEDVEQTIQETLQELEQGASRARQRRRRRRRKRHERQRERERQRKKEEESILTVTEFVSTGELANLMGEPVNDVISTLFDAGMMVSINQRLDADTIEFVADEYGYDVEFVDEFSEDIIEIEEDDPEDLEPRAPVVTVMGHVDHGKTTLLDYVRSANVVAGEEGSITQHIAAYNLELSDLEGEITFLDTPGHEAFTAMRARGAKATDVVILVVAADDAVMPQTVEAINHAQAADVPIVVAINKMDKPEADAQRVMQELAEHNVLVEPYGGDVQCAQISALSGEGVNDLLEKVLLQAELLDLQANPNRRASGIVIESRKEKGRGNVVTALIQNGSLEVGDPFVTGIHSGTVRAMYDERDNRVERVGPAQPVLVTGSNGQPEAGDQFVVMESESEAREVASRRQQIHREQRLRQKSQVSLDQVSRRMAEGEFHELNLIVKADVGGSVEAIVDALLKLKTDEVAVSIIHSGVGAITESDVMLARASDAVILGFQVRPTTGAREAAEDEEVDIRTYSIIYDAIEDVRDALEGLLSPKRTEETLGMAEVRDLFKVPDVGTVAGSYVRDGTISRNQPIRIVREGVVIYDGDVQSLKRFQEDVTEVKSGYECGIAIENFNDIKVGDELESYKIVEEKRTLEV